MESVNSYTDCGLVVDSSNIFDKEIGKMIQVYLPPDENPNWKFFFDEEIANQAVSSSEYLEPPPMPVPKNAWKSNEARRPKTYNCSACNKWFTSSGHLKRHYNTTLHKNAVKQSGGVDPATLPVSSHHQPPEDFQPQLPPPPTPQQEFYYGYHPNGNAVKQSGGVDPATLPVSSHHQPPEDFQPLQLSAPQQEFYYGYHPNGNAVKQSGGVDPATLPVSSHHQPPEDFQPLQLLAPQQEFYYGYHPNGNPPHDHLCSFSSLTWDTFQNSQPKEEVRSTVNIPQIVHKCFICMKTFTKACYLTQHNKSFHSGEKPYKCNQCGKRFAQEYLHMEHLSKHSGEKPYKCEICPKQFIHKTDLRRHMCLHSGDKPYACTYCGKKFIRKDQMLKHAETHKKRQYVINEY